MVCAGSKYKINVQFPERRMSYLSLNSGNVGKINAFNKK